MSMSGVWVLSAVWLVASRSERAHRTLFMCRLERRCSFHGCAAPVFPTPRCGIPALPQPFLSAVPSWDCRGSSKTRPLSYPSRRSCEATVACVRVLFSRVRCTRSGWGLRSPSVPQMIGFLGKMPAAVSVQSFPSRGGVGSAARRVGDGFYLVDPASSHMLVSKIKPCMCKYELIQTVKLRMAH